MPRDQRLRRLWPVVVAYDGLVGMAVAYIDAHLKEELTVRDLAQAVGYSPFHFHRLFQAETGETPAVFIRRRRLAESARELAEPGRRAIDVALAYQYDSQEAFIRAFRRYFGVTPGRYQRAGGMIMEPRIVTREPMTIVGMIYFGENQSGEIPKLWETFNARSGAIPHRVPGQEFGFCFMDEQVNPSFWYMACVPVSQVTEIPAEMVAKTVPAGTYAVFTHRGPVSGLGATYEYAYKTWLPGSGYELAGPPHDFELYDERFRGVNDQGSELDVYVPVKKKA